jgi:transposase-like protein
MSTLSHVHQVFSAKTCHAYLRALRWKDRPFQCPHCHSREVGPWGTYHYRPGFKRYRCKHCERTFNDLTKTLLSQSKRSLPHWILATFLLCLSCSSRRIARELGVHVRTSYRWCWWLRNAALSYETDRHLEGTIEADELYHTAGNKGQAKKGAKSTWDAGRVVAARSVSPARAIMTKTDPQLLRG